MAVPIHSVKYIRRKYRKFQVLAALFAFLTIAATFLVAVSGIQMTILKKKQSRNTGQNLTSDIQAENELIQQINDLNAKLTAEKSANETLRQKVIELESHLGTVDIKAVSPLVKPKPEPPAAKSTPKAIPKPIAIPKPAPQPKPGIKKEPATSPDAKPVIKPVPAKRPKPAPVAAPETAPAPKPIKKPEMPPATKPATVSPTPAQPAAPQEPAPAPVIPTDPGTKKAGEIKPSPETVSPETQEPAAPEPNIPAAQPDATAGQPATEAPLRTEEITPQEKP